MGFAAAPMVPMMIGAGVGALADKENPLRGAMIGAAGGGILGPAASGLTAGGAAAGEAAATAGMGTEAATAASQLGAYAPASYGPEQLAYMGDQLAGGGLNMGTTGIAHDLAAMNPAMMGGPDFLTKLQAFSATGPQGIMSQMAPKDMMRMGGRMLMGQMNQPQPQQAPPPAAGGGAPAPRPQAAPVSRFITGMPQRKKEPFSIWGGY